MPEVITIAGGGPGAKLGRSGRSGRSDHVARELRLAQKSKAHDDHLLAQDDVHATASIIVTAFFSTGIAECNSITSQLEMDGALIYLLLPFTALSCNVLSFAKLTESIHNAAGDSLEWYQGPSHAGKLGVPWPTACLALSKA